MSMPTPPKLAAWLLSQFTSDEALIGDLLERYHEGRSEVWFWKQALWTIAIGKVREIQTQKLQRLFQSTEFNAKGLIVSGVAIGVIVYTIEHPSGVVAVLVGAFLGGGLWRLIPDRWLTRRERLTR